MLHRLPISLVGLSLSCCVGLLGCGGGSDDGNDEVDTTAGDTTAGESGDSTGESTGDGDTTDTTETTDSPTTDTTETTDTTDTTDTTETGMGNCQVWEITYDLTDSEFEISDTPFGAGDQVNVVAEPYDDDDHIGPGTMVLRFQDVGGEPGGQAFVSAYDMDINFVVSGATTVTTDLSATAGPSDCGLATGPLANDSVAWAPAEIADVHTMGTILCEGNLCMLGGLPNGMPVPVDDTAAQATNPFDFNADLTTFSMDQVVIAMDDQSTTSWTYAGTETSRELIDAPDCLCQ
ncbi:hypothetical protein ACNOYE_25120 [Nannocystaceae bacterium ST9]